MTITIEIDEFEKRLHELLKSVTFPEDDFSSSTAIGFNHGAATIYYGACNVLYTMLSEQFAAEQRKEREASA